MGRADAVDSGSRWETRGDLWRTMHTTASRRARPRSPPSLRRRSRHLAGGRRAGGPSPHVRRHLAPRRGQVDVDRGAGVARPRHRRGRRGARQGQPPWRRQRLDGHGARPRHLDHVRGAAVRLCRHGDQPARHARPRRLLGGHLPGARRRRRGRHARRCGQGHRAADPQALRGLPGSRRAGHHGRQQVGPPGPRRARHHGRADHPSRPAPHAADLARGCRRRLPWRARLCHG